MIEVFWRFLLLGCVSFGGPAAHIGYFRKVFVEQLKWLNEHDYAQLVAMSQFLPGPGSSQVGFAIGVTRAGFWGGIAAFVGFTLPSFLIMVFLVIAPSLLALPDWGDGVVFGLKLLAVVVVFDAVVTMSKQFLNTHLYRLVALLSLAIFLFSSSILITLCTLLFAAGVGAVTAKNDNLPTELKNFNAPVTRTTAVISLLVFALIFSITLLALLAKVDIEQSQWLLWVPFVQSGSLVFGGGHVVVPMLFPLIEPWVTQAEFLTGYAAAQAVPGPMFTMATYMGALMIPESMFLGALIATLGIFLPGLALMNASLYFWTSLQANSKSFAAINAVNASVVALLAAALYDPIFTSSVKSSFDILFVAIGVLLIRLTRISIIWLVSGFAVLGVLSVVFN